MKRLFAWSLFSLVAAWGGACGAPQTELVDGAPVDVEGWPERTAELRFRCPEGTSLVDESGGGQRRRATCKSVLNPAPRGFELAWHPNGELALVRRLDPQGRPSSVVQYDPDGQMRVEESWNDGRLMSAIALYPNGKLRSEEAWAPEEEALYVARYAPDGSIEAKGKIVDGAREGEWLEWIEGATERATYQAGQRVGDVSRTYADGSIESGSYVAGERDGLWRRQDRVGLPMKEARYVLGTLQGPWRTWHPNQQLKARGTFQDGRKHGLWTTWHPSGEVAERQYFNCGRPHGLVEKTHPNGQLAERGLWWAGRKVGEWRTWGIQGELVAVTSHSVPAELAGLEAVRTGEAPPPLPDRCPNEEDE